MSKRIKRTRLYQIGSIIVLLFAGIFLTAKESDTDSFITVKKVDLISTAQADTPSGGSCASGDCASAPPPADSCLGCGNDCNDTGDSGGATAGPGESY